MADIPIKIALQGAEEVKSGLGEIKKLVVEAFALGGLLEFTKKGLEGFSKLQAESNKLAASLGHQSESLLKLAEVSSKTTTFRKEEIISGEKLLSQYTKNEEAIKKLLPTMLNLAQRTGSIDTAARMLGLSFEKGSPILTKYGINVKGVHDSEGRLQSIIEQTNAVLGDQNRAAFEAMNPLDKMKKSLDEVSESLGRAVAPEFEKFAKFLEEHQAELEAFAKFIGDHIEEIGLISLEAAVVKSAPGIIKSVASIGKAFMVTPWAAVAVAVGALTVGWMEMQKNLGIAKGNEAAAAGIEKINVEMQDLIKTRQQDRNEVDRMSHEKNLTKAQLDQIHILKVEIEDTTKRLKELGAAGVGPEGVKSSVKINSADDKAGEQAEKKAKELAMKRYQDLNDQYAEEAKLKSQFYQKENEESERHADQVRERQLQRQKQASEMFKSVEEKNMSKSFAGRLKLLDMEQKRELLAYKRLGESTVTLEKRHAEERAVAIKQEYEQRAAFGLSYAQNTIGIMGQIADATKANAQVKKRIAEGEAILGAAQGALGVIQNSGQFIGTFGPVGGPIAMGVEIALMAALAGVQIAQIESAKMAYGGVVTGGTPGVDSVPATLMPGEIVYNPLHPNPTLASMITSSSTNNSNMNNTTHIGGTTIVIQGNPSKATIDQISHVSEKALINALRKAQNTGKITATGMKIRS